MNNKTEYLELKIQNFKERLRSKQNDLITVEYLFIVSFVGNLAFLYLLSK